MNYDLIIRGNRIMTPEGIMEGSVMIAEGKIVSVVRGKENFPAALCIEAGNQVVMPGLIDPHVHINEPGRTGWEGFDTATRAAAAGGITTLIDMPLNSSPVTTDFNSLQLKTNAARKNIHVNCGFWGGVVPGNLARIEELLEGGVFGLKAFLTHSGIDEFPEAEPELLRGALHILKRYDRPLLVHCELSESHDGTKRLKENPGSYAAYLASRPKSWENRAIETMISLCRETGARVHIVHLSSAEALPSIHRAKEEGLPLTVETAPHYLFFAAEEIEDKNTLFKCAPPIRERANNEKLWEALKDGTIDFVATDHSPAPPENKEIGSGDLEKAWGGIAGLQFSLPVTWTAGQTHDVRLQDICAWLSEKPAAFLGLENSKGKIKPGYDADIVIWNPEEAVSLSGPLIQHRHKQTPYSGLPMKGDVTTTLVSGRVVYTGRTFESLHAGRLLLRKPID